MGNKNIKTIKEAKELLDGEEYNQIEAQWRDVTKAQGDLKKTFVDEAGFSKLIGPIDKEDLKTLFSLFDIDNNGTVSWSEYLIVKAQLKKGKKRIPLLASQAEKQLDKKDLEDLKVEWLKITKTDSTKDTSVNYDGFKRLMQEMDEKDLKTLFGLYDQNHDEKISWTEYICVVVRLMYGTLHDKISIVFNCIDDDNNGFLTKEEFHHACQKFGTASDDINGFVDDVFKKCDLNKDKKVTFDEFLHLVAKDVGLFAQLLGTFNPLL